MQRGDLREVGPCCWEIPASYRADLRVPARIYADEVLLDAMVGGEAITQLLNVATLPGVERYVYGMPDMHEGYGFPVGGVAATRLPDGVVSPGGVGFDINCGVRLLTTPLTGAELGTRREALVHEISRSIPTGTGRGGAWRLSDAELEGVLRRGSAFVVREHGDGLDADLEYAESGGSMPGADPDLVSVRAHDRGRDQLGTLGSGNHFLEVQMVDEIFDAPAARVFGLRPGLVTVLIHTGSRGLGHQVCTDYVKRMDGWLASRGIVLPDRQLSCAPVSSTEGREYLAAMAGAANFAFANRQRIAQRVREIVVRLFGAAPGDVRTVYDVAHNMAKVETHGGLTLCVHRKGATRAFGPGSLDIPAAYRAVGQPVFIPGSMGTASYVLAGDARSEERSWGSTCHGAGRALSRGESKRRVTVRVLRRELEAQGIVVRCPSGAGLAEEAPIAYKDVERVAAVVERAQLARRVARLRPIGVVKG